MEVTGNRWRDPDKVYDPKTGLPRPREDWENESSLANPNNVLMDETSPTGHINSRKYGPLVKYGITQVQFEKAKVDAQAIGMPVDEYLTRAAEVAGNEVVGDPGDELSDIPDARSYGDAFDTKVSMDAVDPVPDTVEGAPFDKPEFSDIEQLVQTITTQGPKAKMGDAAAVAELNEIAAYEYSREEGPRPNIKSRLSAFGIKKPQE